MPGAFAFQDGPAALRDDAGLAVGPLPAAPAAFDAPPCKKAPAAPDAGTDAIHGLIPRRGFHPKLIPFVPPPEAFEASPHRPVVVNTNPFAADQNVTVEGTTQPHTYMKGVNTHAMDIQSSLGSGKLELHIKGVANTQEAKFQDKKRVVHVAIQCHFHNPVPAGDLCMGQELFSECAVPLWLSETLLTLAAKTFSATTRVSARTTPRYFMNPVLAACQLINVSRPGEEPDIWEAKEDVTLMLPGAVDSAGNPLASEARRKWCDSPANIQGAVFSPEHVYTFHCYQQYADLGQYKLSLGFLNIDLAPVLQRSPMQVTCKDVATGRYAFSLLVWHERCLYGRGAGGDDDGAASPTASDIARVAAAQLRASANAKGNRFMASVRGLLYGSN